MIAAEQALGEEEAAKAWTLLDDIPSWHSDDVQLAARRVEALLRRDDAPLLNVLRALASLELAKGDVPGVPSWSTERIASLAARARALAERL